MSSVRLSDTWRTTTFRLVLLYGGMFTIGVVTLLAVIYFHTQDFIDQQTAYVLKAELRNYLATPPDKISDSFNIDIQRDSRHIEIYGLFSDTGVRLAGNAERLPRGFALDSEPHLIRPRSSDSWLTLRTDIWGVGARLPDQRIIFLGRQQVQLDEIRQIIIRALGGAVLVILVGTALGIASSIRPIQRLRKIQGVSQSIIQGNIDLRLPMTGNQDELDLLAKIVNKMLDEIAQRMNDIKGAADSVAHDLRTPLTHLRTRLNRLLSLLNAPDQQQLVEEAIDEVDTVLSRFRALLRIAEISGSMRRAMFKQVALQPLLENIKDIYTPLAEEKNVALLFDLPEVELTVMGDGDLLFEAVMNLVDNAVKFAPQNGYVTARLFEKSGVCHIEIENNGQGIPEEELKMVILPFYRSELNRHQSEGYGVGLSIVNAIVNLHGFRLSLNSANGVTRATIECSNRLASEDRF